MRPQLCSNISHVHPFLSPAASNCKRHPARRKKDHVSLRFHRYSSTFRWSEEDASRIYVYGLGNAGRFIANSLARQELRPPTTFLVHSNRRIEQFVEKNGEVEIIEDDVSYVSDGFDIEVVESPPIYESSGSKCHNLKTLALTRPVEFDIELDSNKEHSYSNYNYQSHSYGDLTTFSGHHSAFNCAWDNHLQTVRSGTIPRRINTTDIRVLERELATSIQHPIKNLVIATKPEFVIHALQQLKRRLRPDSTILFVQMQKVVGLMEDVNKRVFPDPSSRPNYLLGLPYHTIWSKEQRSNAMMTNADIMSDLTAQYSRSLLFDHPYSGLHKPVGHLLLGPVIKDRPNERAEEYAKREGSTRYMLSVLLGATPLGTQIIDHEWSLFCRLRDTAINAAVHPLGIMYDCVDGEILQGSDRQAHVRRLLREACRVVRADCPRLTYDHLERHLGRYIICTADNINPMMTSLVVGSSTSIDYVNGWIVSRGAELGIPCPENRAMVEYIKEATKEVIEMKEKIFEERAELGRQARRAVLFQENEEEKRIQIEKAELADIIQARKRKEEKKKRVQLKTAASAKPKPTFEKPATRGLGNSALLTKADQATDAPVEELAGKDKKSSRGKKKKAGGVGEETKKNQVALFKPVL